MGTNVLKFILLNLKRKIFRNIKKNKIKTILYLALGAFLIIYLKDIVDRIDHEYIKFIPIITLLYCIAKLMQDAPTINIRPELIELKVLTTNKFKLLILIKSIFSSILIMTFILLNKFWFYEFEKVIIIMLLINVISNLVCFFIHQVSYPNCLRLVTISIELLAYYYNSIIIVACLLIVLLFYMFKTKYIKYDIILPYYKSISKLFDGFLDGDIGSMSQEKAIFSGKSSSSLNLMEMSYGNNYSFHFYKEISRTIYNKKTLINSCLICFIVSLLVHLYSNKIIVNFFAIEGVLLVADNILSVLNKTESYAKNNGFYLPYSIKHIMLQNFIPQLLITLICVFSGIFLIKHINIFLLIVCIILLPINNILYNFSNNKTTKFVSYLISSLIYYLVFLGVYGVDWSKLL